MWFIVTTLRRSPAGGTDNPAGGIQAALGHRRALVTMNHIATSDAPCREPPECRPHRSGSLHLGISQSKWLITSLSPGTGEKLSKFTIAGGDVAGMHARFAVLQGKAQACTGQRFPLVVIQEAGLDGFWIHRVLEAEGIESHVVDPASIAVSRRKRRVKTDRIDGEMLIRTLLAYKRGEPRVCAMLRVPTPEEEDRRRVARERKALTNERKALTNERIRHTNRIKGLLFGQGINGYEPLRRDRRKRLDAL
ncbi:MAG: transposase, partial [Novosphingobium sp.]